MDPTPSTQLPSKRHQSLKAYFIAILFLVGVFASGCVIHRHDRGHGPHSGPVVVKPRVTVTTPRRVVFTFNDRHRHIVHDYYHRHPHHHHGKKYKHRKRWKYKRKAHLSYGTQIQVIPINLIRQLPPPPRGTQYIYDYDQVLLIDSRTRVVLDFINISVPNEPQVVVVQPTFSFNNHHRRTVRDYYHRHPRHHHGKKHKKKKWKNKKRRNLPPGLRKRDVLPPGIQMQALPVELARQLPPAPRRTRYIYQEDQVLLINVETRVILDFIDIAVSVGF